MPHDFATRLPATDMANLVAYLASRRERDASRVPVRAGGVTAERLAKAVDEPQNALTYWGNYQSTHYSPLTQITTWCRRRWFTQIDVSTRITWSTAALRDAARRRGDGAPTRQAPPTYARSHGKSARAVPRARELSSPAYR